MVYAISPQMDAIYSDAQSRLLFRWPGDDYVDFVGMDCYHGTNFEAFSYNVKSLATLSQVLKKPVGVTETGLENNHTADYWTKGVLAPVKGNLISMVVAWRNEKTNHAYGPYPSDVSADNFKAFYNDNYTLFEKDLPPMYTMPANYEVN